MNRTTASANNRFSPELIVAQLRSALDHLRQALLPYSRLRLSLSLARQVLIASRYMLQHRQATARHQVPDELSQAVAAIRQAISQGGGDQLDQAYLDALAEQLDGHDQSVERQVAGLIEAITALLARFDGLFKSLELRTNFLNSRRDAIADAVTTYSPPA